MKINKYLAATAALTILGTTVVQTTSQVVEAKATNTAKTKKHKTKKSKLTKKKTKTTDNVVQVVKGSEEPVNVAMKNDKVQPKMQILYIVDGSLSMANVISDVKGGVEKFTDSLKSNGAKDIEVSAVNPTTTNIPEFTNIDTGKIDWSNLKLVDELDAGFEAGGDEITNIIKNAKWKSGYQHQIILMADTFVAGEGTFVPGQADITDYKISEDIGNAINSVKGQASLLFNTQNIGGFVAPEEHVKKTWEVVADITNTKVFYFSKDTDPQEVLTESVVEPSSDSGTATGSAEVLSSTYEDGTESHDLTVDVGQSVEIPSGETKDVIVTPKVADNPERKRDTTTVKVEFFQEKNGNKVSKGVYDFRYTSNLGEDVTVKYEDTEGNEISDQETITASNVGDEYDISDKQKDIDGYTFKEVNGDTKGTFSDQAQTVTFVYEKNADPEVPTDPDDVSVNVKFVDKDGKKIADSDKLTGKVGDEYTAKAKDIDGYKLVSKDSELKGSYAETNEDVVFEYDKVDVPVQDDTSVSSNKQLPQTGISKMNNTLKTLGILIASALAAFSGFMIKKNKREDFK